MSRNVQSDEHDANIAVFVKEVAAHSEKVAALSQDIDEHSKNVAAARALGDATD